MATWTIGPGDLSGGKSDATSDGTYIYYRDGGSPKEVYRYDPDTEVGTILGSAFSDNIRDLHWFNGALYLVEYDAGLGGFTKVWKWNGSSWSTVLTINLTGGSDDHDPAQSHLYVDDNNLVLQSPYASGAAGSSDYVLKYSSDGSSWSDGTFTDGLADPYDSFSTTIEKNYSIPNYYYPSVDRLIGTFSISGTRNVYRFNGTDFVKVLSSVGSGSYYITSDRKYHWREKSSGVYEYSTDFATWTEPSTTVIPTTPLGFDVPIGFSYDGSDLLFHWWSSNNSHWETGELLLGGASISGWISNVIRLDDGRVFVFAARDGGFLNWLERDETLDADPDPAPPSSDGRVWVFKTIDSGLTWISRGVQTQ